MTKLIKRSIHLVVALVCCVSLFLAGAFIVPEPITTRASGDINPNLVSFATIGIADGEYTNDANPSGTYYGNLDGKTFSGYVKFGGGAARLYIGGKDSNIGLEFAVNNKTRLTVKWVKSASSNISLGNITKNNSGIIFDNTDFLLGVTFQKDGSDLKVNVSLEQGEGDSKVTYTEDFTATGVANLLGNIMSLKTPSNAPVTVRNDGRAPRVPDKSLNWLSTEHFYVEDGTYGYTDGTVAVSGSYPFSLLNTYFTANLTFSSAEGAQFLYAGEQKNNGHGGLYFRVEDGKLVLENMLTSSNSIYTFDANKAGLTSFTDTEFKLGISIAEKESDIELGIWFNDCLYEESYFTLNNVILGNTIGVFNPSDNGSTVTVGVSSGLEVDMPDKDFTKITIDRFGGLYNNSYQTSHQYFRGNGSLDKTYFSAYLSFSEGNYVYWGSTDWIATALKLNDGSIRVYNSDINTTIATITPSDAGVESFSETFRLGITTEFIDNDNGGEENDVKLKIYINEKLCADFVMNNRLEQFGEGISIGGCSAEKKLTIGIVEDFIPVVTPDESFAKITIDRFNISDGTYNATHKYYAYEAPKENLDKTYFAANVKFEGEMQLYWGSNVNDNSGARGWYGTALKLQSDGALRLYNTDIGATIKTLDTKTAGVSSFLNTFRLGISTEYVDDDNDGNKNDVKLGIFINDKLYGGNFVIMKDRLDVFDNGITFYGATDDSKITINAVKEFKVPVASRPLDSEGFNTITFDSVDIADGIYSYNNNFISKQGVYRKTFDNLYFGGKVTFNVGENGSPTLIYGALSDGWNGFIFMSSSDGKQLVLQVPKNEGVGTTHYYFNADKTLVESFKENAFNLGISTRFVDNDNDGNKDDVELGVWIEDILYGDKYIYFDNFTQYVGNGVNLYSPKDATIVVNSRTELIPPVIPEQLSKDLTKITLSDFAIKDNTYKYAKNALSVCGTYYEKSLKDTYCEFYVNPSLSSKQIAIQYGGSGWTGLSIRFMKDSLYVREASGHKDDNGNLLERYYLYASKSNIESFTNQEFLMGISTEYLDLDGDGSQDDVRFGIWVNNYLCNNEYIEYLDYVQYMGRDCSVYVEEDGATLSLKSVNIPLIFEYFGFTSNWRAELKLSATNKTNMDSTTSTQESPKTGSTPVHSMIFSCVALGGLMDTEKNHRRKLSVR